MAAHLFFLQMLCKKHRVKHLFAFGSVLTNSFSSTSDIDLLVAFDNVDVQHYADNYFDLKFALQDALNHKIDLVEEQAISNPYFKQTLDGTKHLIYGA